MTTQDDKKLISQELVSNSKFDKVSFNERQFKATNRGHGLFVETIGKDVVIDLRISSERPYWGHTHPIMTQHNYKQLNHISISNHYSIPITEFTRMIETFQKTHFSELIKEDFEITYYNVVITIDEKILEYNSQEVISKIQHFITANPKTLFWVLEKDISLLANNHLLMFNWDKNQVPSNVHHCALFHFVRSVYLISNHLFSSDDNLPLFLAMENYFNEVISADISGKNQIDYDLIDAFLVKELSHTNLKRIGRYLVTAQKIPQEKFNNNGIIISDIFPEKTVLSIPLSCTNKELNEALNRIKLSFEAK